MENFLEMKNNLLLFVVCIVFSIWASTSVALAQNKNNKKETVKFYVENMECKNCQAKVEKNIAFEKGVSDIQCDLSTRTVIITYHTEKTNVKELQKGFKKMKMDAVVVTDGDTSPTK